jgi:heat shock protein HtpX
MIKRVFLFLLTNILVVTTISIVLGVLGVQPYLTNAGIDYQALAIFCFIYGMVGALISLALSRIMAKFMMGVKVLEPGKAGNYEGLVQMVHQIAKDAKLPAMPEVGVYESPEVNAFATGPTKRRALVAFSTGILGTMRREEIEAVAAHEIAHIKNGDMVTMTLLQGIVNAFVMFLARAIAFVVSQNVKQDSQASVRFMVTLVLDILLSLLGSMVVAWFSRHREFRADAGAGALRGKHNMIGALESLGRLSGRPVDNTHPSLATMKINGGRGGFWALLASHPPLEQRIAALQR